MGASHACPLAWPQHQTVLTAQSSAARAHTHTLPGPGPSLSLISSLLRPSLSLSLSLSWWSRPAGPSLLTRFLYYYYQRTLAVAMEDGGVSRGEEKEAGIGV